MPSENDFYNKLDKRLDAHRIKDVKSTKNRKLILDFDKDAKLDRKTIATTSTNKEKLVILFSRYITKDWNKVSKEDLKQQIAKIDNSEYSERHKSNLKKLIKQFDKWHNGGAACSDKTSWIKSTPIKRKLNNLTRDDLLTDEEKKKLLQAADSKRDKAIISIWLETGLRPKELRVLKIRDVTVEKDLAYVNVPQDTKTGFRPIPIYFSKLALIDYLNDHPGRGDKNNPLWVKLKRGVHKGYERRVEALHLKGFDEIMKRLRQRTGLKKRLYWYLGRHTSYTDKISQGWNEGILKEFHGIDHGSTVLNRYTHLSAKDVTDKVKEYYGLQKGRKKTPELTIIRCVNCGKENPNTEPRCKKCGYMIDPQEMKKELENRDAKIQEEVTRQMKAMFAEFSAMSTAELIKLRKTLK
jgi:site-specific recombinase XerD